MKNDVLILEVEAVRPKLYVGGLEINGDWQPWHATWQSLKIKKFNEAFEDAKIKISSFYAEEGKRNPQTGCTTRSAGWGKMSSDEEQWTLQNLKILHCKIEDTDKSIEMELIFDGVNYKDFRTETPLQRSNL
jgi:hypothetical protein